MSNHKNHRRKNPVAKFVNVNRPQTHRDRTKYKRTDKFRQEYA